MFEGTVILCPTLEGSEDLCDLAERSVEGLGEFVKLLGPEDTTTKIKDGILDSWERCSGFFIIMHHDFVVSKKSIVLDLMWTLMDSDRVAAGVSEYGENRSYIDYRHFLNTQFLVVKKKAVPEIWEPAHWKAFIEPYWSMQESWLGRIIYLDSEPHVPPIGRATRVLWKGHELGAHLWRSEPDLRVARGHTKVEGCSREDLWSWRKEFVEYWSQRLSVARGTV